MRIADPTLQTYLDRNVAGATLLVAPETGQPTSGDPIEIVLTGPDMLKLQELSQDGKRPVETVVGNGQFRDAGGGTGMTDCGWVAV